MFKHFSGIKVGILAFCLSGIISAATTAAPPPKQGILDLRTTDLNHHRQSLAGDWYYFRNQLITPSEITLGDDSFTAFPQTWNAVNDNKGAGYATYAVFVLLPKNSKSLALEIPQIYSSYRLWVNDQIVAVNGKPGKSEAETIPQWMPQTVSFENDKDTLKVVLQIANFHHYNGGVKDPIYLGSSGLLQGNRSIAVIGNLIESISLALIGLIFLVVFFVMKKKKITLYFSLLCLTWALRVGFSNLYIFISYVPDFNWYAMVRIEYMTLFLTMIWAILFLCASFPKEQSRVVKYLLVIANCIFLAYTALTTTPVFTAWINVYIGCSTLLLLFGVIVVLKAWINQRTGSTSLSISFLLALLIFSYDVFSYEGMFIYNPIIFSLGYVIIFSLMGTALMLNLNFIKTKSPSLSILTYKDLYNNNEA